MDTEARLRAAARAIEALAPAVSRFRDDPELARVCAAVERDGYFAPGDDECLRAWFARYLTARGELLDVIHELSRTLEPTRATGGPVEADRLPSFAVAYTAACLLVRAARDLVGGIATHTLVQRKLNEAEPRFRIPRKQFTAIYRSLTSPVHALRLNDARRFADDHRSALEDLAAEPWLAPVIAHLHEAEAALDVDPATYVRARLRYRWHAWRRRRASAAQQALFGIFEAFGRVIAEARRPGHRPRVTPVIARRLEGLVRPGDVIITRHDYALSNLFLPGYWPHAALHVGTAAERDAMAIDIDGDRAARWIDPIRVLEARKDGVLFRALPDTLGVDAVAIIRPRLAEPDLAAALARAVSHEGKLYNFDFRLLPQRPPRLHGGGLPGLRRGGGSGPVPPRAGGPADPLGGGPARPRRRRPGLRDRGRLRGADRHEIHFTAEVRVESAGAAPGP